MLFLFSQRRAELDAKLEKAAERRREISEVNAASTSVWDPSYKKIEIPPILPLAEKIHNYAEQQLAKVHS